MDCFKEDIVTRRSSMLFDMAYIVCWILLIVLGLYALMLFQVIVMSFSLGTLILFVLAAGLAVLLYFCKDELKVEYEYTFTNGILDFAKVLRGARRKELGGMKIANISACGYVAGKSFGRYLSMKDCDRRNWFLNRDGNLFYLFYEKEGRKHMIVIEPSEEMTEMFRLYVPAGVWQD